MAEQTRVHTYEGMFLFSQSAVADLNGAADHVRTLLDRAEAEVISLGKWDERRLAYDIKGNKRGLYLIAYFKAPTANMASLERDCNLSEQLLRAMVTRADSIEEETMRTVADEQKLRDEAALRKERGDIEDADAESQSKENEEMETADA